MTEDEIVGWHHQPNEREFEQTPGDSEGRGNLACCSPWGHKESDTTEVTARMQSENIFWNWEGRRTGRRKSTLNIHQKDGC